jgi:heme/copper-type cytochrome/quinol oxidase subunit 3
MAVTCNNAFHGRYDHERSAPVRYTAMYWHFLGVVWIVTFSVFMALG